MTQDETLKATEDLTGTESAQENTKGSAEPSEESTKGQEDAESTKNFQAAIQKKQEKIKALESLMDEKDRKLEALEAEKKKQRLAEMDEVDKWKLTAQEADEKRAQLEIKLIVQDAIKGKVIPEAALEVLKETPWVFPAIKKELSLGESTWDETINAVRRNIDTVVEALEVKTENTTVETRKVDTERSVDNAITKDRPITLDEYKAIMAGPDELYIKNKLRIADFIKKNGGVLPTQ